MIIHTREEDRMFTRAKTEPVPVVGAEAPEFNLPSAQGGQLRLSMRTPRGPVVVAFYRPGDEVDVEYFKALAAKEEEINLAAGSVVAIGVAEPTEALNFARASGLKSYVLYDYARVTSRQWGLWEKDRRQGDYARRAVFVVGPTVKSPTPGTARGQNQRRFWRRSARLQASPNLRRNRKRMGKRAKRRKAVRSRRRCRPRNGRRSRPNAGRQEKRASP